MRGLKHMFDGEDLWEHFVAPYMGAWIETRLCFDPQIEAAVAPYMGAWIETVAIRAYIPGCRVAPYMGAWIETRHQNITFSRFLSHPIWVRGLKRTRGAQAFNIAGRTLYGCVD